MKPQKFQRKARPPMPPHVSCACVDGWHEHCANPDCRCEWHMARPAGES